MKKVLIVFYICFLPIILNAFPNEVSETPQKYFVYTDVLNTRNKPSIQGERIKTFKFGDIIYVYETQGSCQYKDGILDKWCRISKDDALIPEWVNYYFVVPFPFKIDLDKVSEIRKHNSYAMNVYDELPERIYINDIEFNAGKKFFLCEIDDSSYYHKDLEFKKEVSQSIIDFIPPSYIYIDYVKRFTKDGNVWRDVDGGESLTALPEDAEYLDEYGFWIVRNPNKELIKKINIITIQDNCSIRMYNFCENFRKSVDNMPTKDYSYNNMTTTILSDKTVLNYGIKIGMSSKQLIEILGKPNEIKGNIYKYEASSTGAAEIVSFIVKNNTVISIQHNLEK